MRNILILGILFFFSLTSGITSCTENKLRIYITNPKNLGQYTISFPKKQNYKYNKYVDIYFKNSYSSITSKGVIPGNIKNIQFYQIDSSDLSKLKYTQIEVGIDYSDTLKKPHIFGIVTGVDFNLTPYISFLFGYTDSAEKYLLSE